MSEQIAIYQDQRIAEEFCNFKCEYCEGFCPTAYSLKKDKEGNLTVAPEWFGMIEKLPKKIRKHFEEGRKYDSFYKLAEDIIKDSKEIIKPDVLKISGGEVTIYQGLCDFVERLHNNYFLVQILSNGSNIRKEDIERYKKMGNITFQISLDGVTPEANYGKSHSSVITKRVVDTVKLLLENGIGVEINCVLTKYNADKFLEFLEYFKDSKNLMIVPRPVRGEARTVVDFNNDQTLVFEQCITENYDAYSQILPPKAYFDRLIEMMKSKDEDKSIRKCYIPYFIQSIDGYGNFEMCPIGLLYSENANIYSEGFDKDSLLINSCYNVNECNNKCNYCINQYELFNLYVDDLITLDDLRKMPSMNNEVIIEHIEKIKTKIKERYKRD